MYRCKRFLRKGQDLKDFKEKIGEVQTEPTLNYASRIFLIPTINFLEGEIQCH